MRREPRDTKGMQMSKREAKRLHKMGIFAGIIAATSAVLAGELEEETEEAEIRVADQWARRMRTLATDGRE